MYLGDIRLGESLDCKFTTRSFTTGAPTTLAGTPTVAAYPGNSTTEITAGITLTVDFDTRTGLNNVRVVATSGNGYLTATNYTLVITAGTVGGVSVVGEVVGSFSIEARSALMPTTAGRTLDVSAGGEAGVDWANVGTPGSPVSLSATTVATVTTTTTATNLTTNNDKTGYALSAAGVGAVWDRSLATHTTADTAGWVLNMLTQDNVTLSTDVALGSIIGQLLDNGTAWSYDRTTDSLEALRDRGDAAWITATGFSTHAAADVWSVATRQLTATQTFNVTGDITGNLSGSVGSVTGAVGSVTGAVGSVTGAVGSVTGAVGSVTGNVGGNVVGSVGSLAAQAKADVNAEVVDGLATDTYAEPGQGAPGATVSLKDKIGFLYKAWRNKADQTSTLYQLYADNTTTVDQKATVSDDATTFTKGEVATGP